VNLIQVLLDFVGWHGIAQESKVELFSLYFMGKNTMISS